MIDRHTGETKDDTLYFRIDFAKGFLLILFAILVCCGSIPTQATAATYYVDWDNGSDTLGTGSTSSPWKTPWYASAHIASGDTVIVHAKQDGSPYNNGTSAIIDAQTPNTTWKAAPGEVVRLSITATWGNTSWVGTWKSAVAIGANNVVFDGFYVWGQVHLGAGADFSTIQNCDLSGGNGGRDSFAAPIYLHGFITTTQTVTDWTDGVRIYNNRIHSNVRTSPETAANNPLIMFYGAKDTVIENNEFWGGVAAAVKIKDHSNGQIVRYNWFRDTPVGVQACTQYCTGSGMTGISVYQNLFTNITTAAISLDNGAEFLRVYNNTFYNSGMDVYWWKSTPGQEYFNNIHYHSSGAYYFRIESTNWTISHFVYANYNRYYSVGVSPGWYISGTNNTTLTGWRSFLINRGAGSSNGEANSISTNPNFTNGSGTFKSPDDFKRSSYSPEGRGGTWPSVMGAYITGNEIIGLTGGIQPPNSPPTAPTGLVVN